MKTKITTILMMAIAVFASCSKILQEQNLPSDSSEEGTLLISLKQNGASTRATEAYTAMQNYEKQINSVQILVFDTDGNLSNYHNAGTSTEDISINSIVGKKTVLAVVNGPNMTNVNTLSDCRAKAVDLSENSVDASEGFIMVGEGSADVESGKTDDVPIVVSRLVSRVALVNINNKLPAAYGGLNVNYVYLTNVVGNQNLDGSAAIKTWYNKMGREDSASSANNIIDGSTYHASCPDLTFHSIAQNISNGAGHAPAAPYLFYGYPNDTVSDVQGWSASFTPRKTRLVVVAEIKDTRYYYPVVLDELLRNHAYTVDLSISGFGSSDPDIPVKKGALTVSVTVKDWQTGTVYTETI